MLHGSRSFSNFSWAIKFFLCANWRMVCPIANASCAIFAPVADHGRQAGGHGEAALHHLLAARPVGDNALNTLLRKGSHDVGAELYRFQQPQLMMGIMVLSSKSPPWS